MSVCRVNKNENYTVMCNIHLRDKNLSLKSKGLLSVVLSLPDDWDYSIDGLCHICGDGETSVKSALKELSNYGYLTVTKLYPGETQSGRIEYMYDFYETPKQDTEKQGIENLCLENLAVEILGVENIPQLNTNKQNTDILNTNILNKEKRKKESKKKIDGWGVDAGDFLNALLEFEKMREKIKKPMTERAKQLLLGKLRKLSNDEAEQIQILDQSILHGWQDVYPLKEEESNGTNGKDSECVYRFSEVIT